MSHQQESTLDLVLYVPGPTPPPKIGFWSRVAQALGRTAGCVGGSIAGAYFFVDPDLRRELASLPLMALSAIGPRTVRIAEKPADGTRPVIFVHGLAGHRGNFRAMSAWFRANGRKQLYAVSLPRRHGADVHTEYLRRFIEKVLAANGLPDGQVDLVAHSRGGIIARLALDDVATARRVAILVTIGTPHGGTATARYARSRQLDELRLESPVVARLKAQLPWTGPRMVCLWSSSDVLVAPPANAQVEGAANIELDGLTHSQMLLWPAGWRAAFEAISEEAVA
jgi:pimeloyl-ACP methyl ester carboxylesterase